MTDIIERITTWEGAIDSVCDAGVPLDGPALKKLLADAKAAISHHKTEHDRILTQLNTPELIDFTKAVALEAVHQQERWPSDHDDGKSPGDWFWLIGYLAQKAMYSAICDDREKMLHHAITTAAALANWHLQMLNKCNMRPGISHG